MNTINWSLVLLDITRRAGHNEICDSARIMVYEVMKHKSKACLDYDKITLGVRMHLL